MLQCFQTTGTLSFSGDFLQWQLVLFKALVELGKTICSKNRWNIEENPGQTANANESAQQVLDGQGPQSVKFNP